MNIKIVENGNDIRKRFSENFLLSWKEFKTENNEWIKLMTGKGYSLSSNMLHLYELIAISKETSFESAIKRLKAKEGDVYFMSEDEYVSTVCDFLEYLPWKTTIHRLAGNGLRTELVAPRWIGKKLDTLNRIDREFIRRDSKQGSRFCPKTLLLG